jgi:hypothetical protein
MLADVLYFVLHASVKKGLLLYCDARFVPIDPVLRALLWDIVVFE